ncbi:MAG: hypothetical protein HKO92_02465 [Flavobacteriaceae bacterium]|nr:hypothetical protein [Flavobacteriaceae bacterium]
MEQHTEQHFDDLIKKVIKDAPIEKPTLEFTSNVMDSIEMNSQKKIVYKPLISKIGWFAIITILSGISIYMMISNNENSLVLDALDFSIVSNNGLVEILSGIKFTKIFGYAVCFFGIAWLIQVSVLKNYFNNRLQY